MVSPGGRHKNKVHAVLLVPSGNHRINRVARFDLPLTIHRVLRTRIQPDEGWNPYHRRPSWHTGRPPNSAIEWAAGSDKLFRFPTDCPRRPIYVAHSGFFR